MDDRSGEALSQGSIFLYDFSYISLGAYVHTPPRFLKDGGTLGRWWLMRTVATELDDS